MESNLIFDEILKEAQKAKENNLHYCCPSCLVWYGTPEEKQVCINSHGFTILTTTQISSDQDKS